MSLLQRAYNLLFHKREATGEWGTGKSTKRKYAVSQSQPLVSNLAEVKQMYKAVSAWLGDYLRTFMYTVKSVMMEERKDRNK